jgi:hypothetical protein
MVNQVRHAQPKETAALRAQCIEFASAIISRWQENRYAGYRRDAEPCALLESLQVIDDPELIKSYLARVLARDASIDPGKLLVEVCTKNGWVSFQPQLEIVFQSTTGDTMARNLRFLEQLCLAKPRKKVGWRELCRTLAQSIFQALALIDQDKAPADYRAKQIPEPKRLSD